MAQVDIEQRGDLGNVADKSLVIIPVLDGNLTQDPQDLGARQKKLTLDLLASQADLETESEARESHESDTSNPHGVTKAQVGLGNVDNTTDANKPVSTAQAIAIDAAKSELRGGVATEGDNLAKLLAKIEVIQSIVGGTDPDGGNLISTVTELLEVFSTYPEGTDIATVLAGKINTSAIVNSLTEVTTGKVLDATQGKVLKDLIDVLSGSIPTALSDLSDDPSHRTVSDSEKEIWSNSVSAFLTVQSFTDHHTLTAGDINSIVLMNKVTDINLYIPSDSEENLPVGFQCIFKQKGVGQILFVPNSGVTLEAVENRYKSRSAFSMVALIKEASNLWSLSGDIA